MSTATLYRDKGSPYFVGERRDIIDRLPINGNCAILEIGCGDGATGAYAKSEGKCGHYVGIEHMPEAAEVAAGRLDAVYVADIESFDPPFAEHTFDVMIASEVLEHLIDPWRVLRIYRRFLKAGSRVFASSPNIAHKATLAMLVGGGWDLTAEGVMDRTHLRWFTPRTYAAMFQEAGFEVVSLAPLIAATRRARLFNSLTGNRFAHLFISQMLVEARPSDAYA
ncbi:MAG TPA: class I SAM-dependent methyltransferase [Caulobacteraceae bacterium]|jgi:2-polyprenyl-3-methyl-5-hydroxy-6-metoxy-1,4-benzoquinol methylase|nr:class I SAM-dependent methyltransferase [Caulobacteraceae bacterium]